MSRNRTRHPENIHIQFVGGEYGATTVAEEGQRADDILRFDHAPRKRVVEGAWTDGSAGREMARALEAQGLIIAADERGTMPEVQGTGPVPTFTLLAGTGSVAASDGTDLAGIISVTPSDTNVTGTFLELTFAVPMPTANYAVVLFPRTSFARTVFVAGMHTTTHATTGFRIASATALSNGDIHAWSYIVVPF